MIAYKKEISDIVDKLPEAEQLLVLEIVKRFLPDDVATDDDLKAISYARDEYRNGETTNHEDLKWD